MALVTLDDIENLTKRNLTAEEEAAVVLLIEMLQGELEDHCNRPVSARVITDEPVTIRSDGRVFLRYSPVISVEAVNYRSPVSAYTGTYTLVPGGLDFGLSTGTVDLTVSYTAGLAEPDNQGLKSILLARLSRIMAKVHDDALGVSSLAQEGYNAAYLEEGWTEQELKVADRRRRRTVRT